MAYFEWRLYCRELPFMMTKIEWLLWAFPVALTNEILKVNFSKKEYAKNKNRQVALKPQDLYVLLALLSRADGGVGYTALAQQTGLAISAVHAALKRAAAHV